MKETGGNSQENNVTCFDVNKQPSSLSVHSAVHLKN